jgi:Na+-translocating ferredoxin:NAD+ oxidoreductase RnfG subunit
VVSKDGFAGPVAVSVTFDENGVITALTIGDEKFAETAGFGEAAKEPAFTEQFIGKKAPLKLEDIEAISSATMTTEAVLDAINEAAEQNK